MSLPVPWLDRLAHDLRGPLTPLQTAAYLLKSGHADAAQQQELFTMIERQTRVMGSMIDELSDWSQANRGVLLAQQGPCEVSLLLDVAFSMFKPANGTLPAILDESDGAHVLADQMRLIEAFRTLVGYATSRATQVAASVRVCNIDGILRMEIVAPGHVADATEIATLFENPVSQPYDGGLGLKLLIARAIVIAHSGSLTAEAQSTGGLRIQCDLPVVYPAAE